MQDRRRQAHALVGRLARDRPALHVGGHVDYGASDELLHALADLATPGGRTAETGCGLSTAVLALLSEQHVAVSPSRDEHVRLRALCAEHGVPVDGLETVEGLSQDVLPAALPEDPLDLALIDGHHGMPVPFVDFCHLGDALRRDGVLVVDDCQLRSGYVLRQFLVQDTPRWRHEGDVGRAAVFRKRVGDRTSVAEHREQPWGADRRYPVPGDGARLRVQSLRTRARLRSRARALRAG